jgi:hypothetical protein
MESLNYEVEVREREKQSLKPRSKEVSQQRSLTAKESHHRKEVSQQSLAAKMSCTKASVSQLEVAVF